ncbi:hypothetical protein ACFPN2_01675 [Steroidobacter flavus]|uniref:DUF1496 domain-containing protein n=1 Tax=Steroidobacter flavus TaxID=1842136 RepID=A0ABV8SJS6_9GAMM
MATPVGLRNVGAVDPTLKTSPVLEETAEESYEPRHQIPEMDVCYFNGEMFATGELVRSGTMVLKCRDGVWLEIGPADPDNP